MVGVLAGIFQSILFSDCLGVESGEDKDIADGLGEHQHTKDGDDARRHSHGDVEKEGERDEKPDKSEMAVFIPGLEVERHNDRSENHKGYVADHAPKYVAVVFQPFVLWEQTKDDADGGQHPYGGGEGLFLSLPIGSEPDIIHEHVENGHGDGGDELPDAQRRGKVCVHEVVEDTGNEMKSVPKPQRQCRRTHELPGSAIRPTQDHYAAENGKEQIKNVKC